MNRNHYVVEPMSLSDYAAAAAQPRSDVMYDQAMCTTEKRAQGIAAGAGQLKSETPPVIQTLESLVNAQNVAADRLEALFMRLETVLSPAPPVAENPSAGRPPVSQLDEALQFRVNAEWRHVERIDDLLRRLSI